MNYYKRYLIISLALIVCPIAPPRAKVIGVFVYRIVISVLVLHVMLRAMGRLLSSPFTLHVSYEN